MWRKTLGGAAEEYVYQFVFTGMLMYKLLARLVLQAL